MERYVEWLKSNGATFDAIQWPAATPKTGRGAIATRDVLPQEPFLTVPSKLIIDPPRCRADPDIGKFLSSTAICRESHELTLAVYLCHESIKGENSFWYPYLSMLPKPSGSIYTWSTAELRELQDPGVVDVACSTGLEERRQLYGKIISKVEASTDSFVLTTNSQTLTFDLFMWAMDTVCCRSFGRRIQYVSLVPLADNLNHSNVQTKYSYDGKTFKLFPTGDNIVKAGSEAFNSYGRRSNTDLIFNYGFALENNEWDEISLTLTMPAEIRALSEKKRRLIPGPLVARLKLREECLNLFVYFRICCATDKELDPFFANDARPSLYDFEFVSIENELCAMVECADDLDSILKNFPTSLEEDQHCLETFDITTSSVKLLFAIRYRLGRKKVVKFHADYVSQLITLLQNIIKNPEKLDPERLEDDYLTRSKDILSEFCRERAQMDVSVITGMMTGLKSFLG